MRPISSSFFENSTYFSVGMSLLSQASWTKNFKTSRRDEVLVNKTNFCSGDKQEAVKLNSSTSMNV